MRSFAALVVVAASCASPEDVAVDVVGRDVGSDVGSDVASDVVAVAGDVAVGHDLFVHAWVRHDERSHGGDGLGPRENASSCVACHNAGGVGGAGAVNVSTPNGAGRNTPSLFGAGLIDSIPDEVIEENARRKGGERSHVDAVSAAESELDRLMRRNGFSLLPRGPDHPLGGRVGRTPEGFVTRFGWKGDVRDLHAFVTQACAHELGLEVPGAHQPPDNLLTSLVSDPAIANALSGLVGTRFGDDRFDANAGVAQRVDVAVANSAAHGAANSAAHAVVAESDDVEGGYDLDLRELVSLTAFSASLPRPVEVNAGRAADEGRGVFAAIGCTDCHQQRLGDVDGLYSDLLLHDMGAMLSDRSGAYGQPAADENASFWRTPPLWGVAVSAPYLHDGRARNLEDTIRAHGGEGALSRDAFLKLHSEEQSALLAFLGTLQAPSSPPSSPPSPPSPPSSI